MARWNEMHRAAVNVCETLLQAEALEEGARVLKTIGFNIWSERLSDGAAKLRVYQKLKHELRTANASK